MLTATHFVQDAVIVGHLGGESTLEEAGNLELGSSVARGPGVLTDVFVVEPHIYVARWRGSAVRRLQAVPPTLSYWMEFFRTSI